MFEFNVKFDRPYNKDTDKIFLEFATGNLTTSFKVMVRYLMLELDAVEIQYQEHSKPVNMIKFNVIFLSLY